MPGDYPDDLSDLIQWPREERNLEFKCSTSWTDAATKAKLTKSVLAMANLRDGGHIILGVERQTDDSYLPVGMQTDHVDSFVQDQLSAHFSEYADPYIEIWLIRHRLDGKIFCILRVNEFAELPVVCKKDGLENLRRGAMYTRSRRLPETVAVPSQVEMREILDLAIEKRSRAFAVQAARMSLVPQPQRDEFVDQLKRLPESEVGKRIRSMGHWRAWIRPTVFETARFQDLGECRVFALRNSVSNGGWQYPPAHDHRIVDGAEWVGSEVDFPPHLERWDLFRSGQFLYRFALAEEFLGTPAWPTHPQFFVPGERKRYLHILRTLMIVTCIWEFAARMASNELLDPSASIAIELHALTVGSLPICRPNIVSTRRTGVGTKASKSTAPSARTNCGQELVNSRSTRVSKFSATSAGPIHRALCLLKNRPGYSDDERLDKLGRGPNCS
jgi:hypothetical protein